MTRREFMQLAALLATASLVGCGKQSDSDVAPTPAPAENTGTFTLTFITVGKGDAFLFTCPDSSHYLLDTGKDEDYVQIARTLRVKGIETLDGIFITHGHHDHAGSLESLVTAFPTKKIYYSGKDDSSYTDILPGEIAQTHDVEPVLLEGGEVLDLGGVQVNVWLPAEVNYFNQNDNSVILRLTHGNQSFLLMGDTELDEESEFMASGETLRANVLKLGHHGETDSTSDAFLNQVKPEIALITGNEEENPDSVNLPIQRALKQRSITPYYSESDRLAIDFSSDGNTLVVADVTAEDLPRCLDLSFAEVDRAGQRIQIRNNADTPADLTGCMLYSKRGDECFFFPAGTTLQPDETLAVACIGHEQPGDLVWQEEKIWHKSRDTAVLYDRNLNELALDRVQNNK